MTRDPDETDRGSTRDGSNDDDAMMQDPDAQDEPQPKGGRAAERLRQHLEERFGEEAPPIPPDEEGSEESEESDESDEKEGSEEPEEPAESAEPAEPAEPTEPGS